MSRLAPPPPMLQPPPGVVHLPGVPAPRPRLGHAARADMHPAHRDTDRALRDGTKIGRCRSLRARRGEPAVVVERQPEVLPADVGRRKRELLAYRAAAEGQRAAADRGVVAQGSGRLVRMDDPEDGVAAVGRARVAVIDGDGVIRADTAYADVERAEEPVVAVGIDHAVRPLLLRALDRVGGLVAARVPPLIGWRFGGPRVRCPRCAGRRRGRARPVASHVLFLGPRVGVGCVRGGIDQPAALVGAVLRATRGDAPDQHHQARDDREQPLPAEHGHPPWPSTPAMRRTWSNGPRRDATLGRAASSTVSPSRARPQRSLLRSRNDRSQIGARPATKAMGIPPWG
jgi:hypothetical protein